MYLLKNSVLFLVIFVLASCNNNDQELIPDVYVDIEINVDNQEYLPLRQDGGFVNINGGVEGIILYQEGGEYSAYERNCPYQPSADCAKVEVDASLLFIQCPCCSSQFNFEGSVTSGPAVLPLKQYSTTLNGNLLRIRN